MAAAPARATVAGVPRLACGFACRTRASGWSLATRAPRPVMAAAKVGRQLIALASGAPVSFLFVAALHDAALADTKVKGLVALFAKEARPVASAEGPRPFGATLVAAA